MNSDAANLAEDIEAAAELIADADSLLITAGVGMGIDSGLPDFRGDGGFWQAYPALGDIGLRFYEIANPAAFRRLPDIAWGFYGHRLRLYRETAPHRGFGLLRALMGQMPKGAFVYTSNVDGQFQKAGFDEGRVLECHGSIHWLQCMRGCGGEIWSSHGFDPQVDAAACRLTSPFPTCPLCGGVARPNILMFGDGGWLSDRTARQSARLEAWLARVQRPVVMEIGAGTAIPTVREFGEGLGCPLIRINPTEPRGASRAHIGIPLGGREGIERIVSALNRHAGDGRVETDVYLSFGKSSGAG